MTIPIRPVRHRERERRFDLRTTALFFVLLAIILCLLGWLARLAAGVAERRPLWAGVLVVLCAASAMTLRSRWRRFSAARVAGRAARALEEAAEKAADSLHLAAPDLTVPPVPAEADRPAPCDELAEYVEVTEYTELDPDGFEEAIADLCARDDCRDVQVVGGANDLGADVIAVTPDGRRMVVQCKRYAEDNKVGSQDLQRFGGTCFTVHKADVAALVTTSDFTAPALAYAQATGIVCVNGEDLRAWCDGTGPSPWADIPLREPEPRP
ncbi:restriction endonuclease [Streptomyces sp. NPDC051452]|uniref:restriction endonuclease n=1 Tax=Streptomyces sp. NPDC051452 TaxID=3365654 RepID=UPI0037B47C5D